MKLRHTFPDLIFPEKYFPLKTCRVMEVTYQDKLLYHKIFYFCGKWDVSSVGSVRQADDRQ